MESATFNTKLPFASIGTFDLAPHIGEKNVATLEEVDEVETPPGGEQYTPLPHGKAFRLVRDALEDVGMHVMESFHALARSGQRYMALLPVMPQKPTPYLSEYYPIVGVRNSHDQQFAFELLIASGIYGVQTLFFNDSEAVGMKRHVNLTDTLLYDAISDAAFSLPMGCERQERRFRFYRKAKIETREEVHHLVFRLHEEDLIPSTYLVKVMDAWDNPPHPAMDRHGDSVWKLLNCVLHARKGKYVFFQPSRNEDLAFFFDDLANYEPELFGELDN